MLEAASHESALWQPDGVFFCGIYVCLKRWGAGSRLEAWYVCWLFERPLCGCGKSFGALIAQFLFYSNKSFIEWTWLPGCSSRADFHLLFQISISLFSAIPARMPTVYLLCSCSTVSNCESREAVSHLYQETHKRLFNEQRHTLSLLRPWFPAVSNYKES